MFRDQCVKIGNTLHKSGDRLCIEYRKRWSIFLMYNRYFCLEAILDGRQRSEFIHSTKDSSSIISMFQSDNLSGIIATDLSNHLARGDRKFIPNLFILLICILQILILASHLLLSCYLFTGSCLLYLSRIWLNSSKIMIFF